MSYESELPFKKNPQEILAEDPKLSLVVSRLQSLFNPLHIYLFGSRVTGLNRVNSDYDFVVVVSKTEKSRLENMQFARQALFDLDVSVDVFVYEETEFNEWKNELNSIPEAAYNLGVELSCG
ncbi:nucleotidyltransferase domain-containing protein [Bdellovibrio sp. HCB-162]|uniref:nucleotidyltransferase domain-containing protein n=1 Tax=Bdellovibrio sp. HCB-162 TaxID=3394234 RepID=UPI0039BCC3F5